ncbi:MAG: DUF86 domain-containing protein [Actinobacteria bacterium]|nr:MAG: DUF86 domain-containing protein [Actinomycetota bacterium]
MDMLLAARRAHVFVSESEADAFRNDRMLRSAVEHCLILLGEAASSVSDECRRDLAETDWPGIVEMRNQLVHGYRESDPGIVWAVVSDELPRLITMLEREVPAPDDVPDRPEWERM